MWTIKEIKAVVFICMFCAGALIASALADTLNGFNVGPAIIAVILSAVNILISLYMIEDYEKQGEKR